METNYTFACVLLDEVFKLTIANPEHEELLRGIIELLLPGKRIGSLRFGDREQHGLVISDKNTNFDLYCTEEGTGEQFIVEMQMAAQATYTDRMLAYATYPIHAQLAAKLGKVRAGELSPMDYSLSPVYVVSIVNFSLPHQDERIMEDGMISRYEIRSGRTGELMTGALNFVYLELGRLRWGEAEAGRCETLLEQFAHSVKYMHRQARRPDGFEDKLIQDLYKAAEMAGMSIEKRAQIDKQMTTQLDINGWVKYAREEGLAEGHAKGKAEGKAETLKDNVQKLLAFGMTPEDIAKALQMPLEEVEALAGS